METINEVQDEIIEEFSGFDDWMDKYQLLIDMGSGQEPLPEEYKTEQNLIDGCQSRVWLQADYRVPRRKRRADCKRYCGLVGAGVERTYAARDSRCRPLLHRPYRTERASFAHPKQRSGSHAQTNENVRFGFQGQRGNDINTPSLDE